jgi:hypothetical protein
MHHFLNNILLRNGITPQHIGNTTQQNGISKLNIIIDIFLQQLNNKLTQPTPFQLNLNTLNLIPIIGPILSIPLINLLIPLNWGLVVLFNNTCN